jgi:hypothetical protein
MKDAAACVGEPRRIPVSSAKDGCEALRFILSLTDPKPAQKT